MEFSRNKSTLLAKGMGLNLKKILMTGCDLHDLRLGEQTGFKFQI